MTFGRRLGVRPGGAGLAAVLAVIVVAAWFIRPERLTYPAAVMSLILATLGLVPGLLWLRRPAEGRLPFAAGMGAFYALFFGISPFLVDFIWPSGLPIQPYFQSVQLGSLTGRPMAFALAGFIAMMAGYWGILALAGKRLPRISLGPCQPAGAMVAMAWCFVALHIAPQVVSSLNRVPSINQLYDTIGYVGFGLALMLAIRRKIARWHIALFALALCLRLLLGVQSAQLAKVVLILGFLVFVIATVRPRLLMPLGGLLLAFFVLGYLPMLEFRRLTWGELGGDLSRLTITDKARLVTTALANITTDRTLYSPGGIPMDDGRSTINHSAREAGKRINQAVVLGLVVEATPQRVPYWAGETYKPLMTSVVPRVLWPGKPQERSGHIFGLRYGLIPESSANMSVNLPWVTESYANFGWAGLGVMAAAGLALGLLALLFDKAGLTDSELVLGAALLFPLIIQESNLSLMTGTLPLKLLCLAIGMRLAFALYTRAAGSSTKEART